MQGVGLPVPCNAAAERRNRTRSVPSRKGQLSERKVTKAARPPKKPPQVAKKRTERAVPAGTPPSGGKRSGEAAGRSRGAAKDLIGLVRSFGFGALIRGLQNLEAPFGKVLILLVGSCCLGGLIRGLQNLELPERERFYSFRLYEKNGEYPRGLRTSGLRGRFKSPLDT